MIIVGREYGIRKGFGDGRRRFIGSWTVDHLLEKGYRVRILDNLQPRVHPHGKPAWVPAEAEFIQGDVAWREDMEKALAGMDYVIHLAAYQDYMPDFSTFIHTNAESSALIFELVVSDPQKYPLQKVVFASSQSVCGEGRYLCPDCYSADEDELSIAHSDQSGRVHAYRSGERIAAPLPPPARSAEQLRRGDWELHCGLRRRSAARIDRWGDYQPGHHVRHFEICHRTTGGLFRAALRYPHCLHALYLRSRAAQFVL